MTKLKKNSHLILLKILLPSFLCLITACSDVREMTPADRQYVFLPQEIQPFPFKNYQPRKAWDDVSYIFFTKYTERDGFTAVYAAILADPAGKQISFLCSVNIERTALRGKQLYAGMVPEHSPRQFGRQVPIDPAFYRAEQAYLYVADTGYFHLVLQSSRIVYSIVLEGASVDERQVRRNLLRKLDYIRENVNLIR